MSISDDDIKKALANIARTPDGETLYLHLQKTLMGVENDLSALQEHHGYRRFARDLMALMREGISDRGGRDARERPVIFEVRQPSRVGPVHPRGGERRVAADTEVPGFTSPEPKR